MGELWVLVVVDTLGLEVAFLVENKEVLVEKSKFGVD